MKVGKFICLAFFVTFFALFYVWQQTEIFRLAYAGGKRATALQDLLDKNSGLRYNIQRNASLTRLSDKISGEKDFYMPKTFRLLKVTTSEPETLNVAKPVTKKQTLLSRLFGVSRQAEAKTINP